MYLVISVAVAVAYHGWIQVTRASPTATPTVWVPRTWVDNVDLDASIKSTFISTYIRTTLTSTRRSKLFLAELSLVPFFGRHFWTAVFFASGYFQYLSAVAWAKTMAQQSSDLSLAVLGTVLPLPFEGHSSATGVIGFSSWGRAFAFSQSTKMLLEMHFSGWILFVVWFHRHWNAGKLR